MDIKTSLHALIFGNPLSGDEGMGTILLFPEKWSSNSLSLCSLGAGTRSEDNSYSYIPHGNQEERSLLF